MIGQQKTKITGAPMTLTAAHFDGGRSKKPVIQTDFKTIILIQTQTRAKLDSLERKFDTKTKSCLENKSYCHLCD